MAILLISITTIVMSADIVLYVIMNFFIAATILILALNAAIIFAAIAITSKWFYG